LAIANPCTQGDFSFANFCAGLPRKDLDSAWSHLRAHVEREFGTLHAAVAQASRDDDEDDDEDGDEGGRRVSEDELCQAVSVIETVSKWAREALESDKKAVASDEMLTALQLLHGAPGSLCDPLWGLTVDHFRFVRKFDPPCDIKPTCMSPHVSDT
jgi:hypothetical protein